MHIECNKIALNEAINTALKAVSSRSTMDILLCLLLVADREGFRIIGNDLKLSIETANIEGAEVYTKGTIALDAKLFSEIVRSLPTENVVIKTDDNFNCSITSGKSVFNIKGTNGEQFPVPEQITNNQGQIQISSTVLKNMIRQTIFSVAVEENRPVLTGELMKFNNGNIDVVAIDGYRVSWRKAQIDFDSYNELVVPSKTLNEVCRLLPDKEDSKVEIVFSAKHIMFTFEGCKVVSRLLDGDYLNYENFFSGDYDLELTISTSEFLTALSRATIISDNSKKPEITLKISDRILNVKAETPIGTLDEDILINVEKGDDLTILFNARYLIEALNVIEEEYVKLCFNTDKSPCVIKGITNDNFKYMVLPINKRR